MTYEFCNCNAHAAIEEYRCLFLTGGFRLREYFHLFTRQCAKPVVFQVSVCRWKEKWYLKLTYERTFLRWFRKVQNFALIKLPLASVCHVHRCDELYMRMVYTLITIRGFHHLEPGDIAQHVDLCHCIAAYPQLLSFYSQMKHPLPGMI